MVSPPSPEVKLQNLLKITGIETNNGPWNDVFKHIAESESPRLALYCLYVVLGWPELTAYRTVTETMVDKVPPEVTQQAKPYIAAVIARHMPSRSRLLANMTRISEDPKVEGSVQSAMTQFMARYLLDEPAVSPQAQKAGQDSGLQEIIQRGILERGGMLIIPPEGKTLNDMKEALPAQIAEVVDGNS